MILGFSSGCMHTLYDRFSKEIFFAIRDTGCQALQIQCGAYKEVFRIKEIQKEWLESFSYRVFHMPKFLYDNNAETKRLLTICKNFIEEYNVDHLILHPDTVLDWDIFKEYNLPILIENMDNRKKFGRNVADLEKIFKNNNYGMCLDVNHIYTNDVSMKLGYDMWKIFKERIKLIHVSGYKKEKNHAPLFQTQQEEILSCVLNTSIPIIIESTVGSVYDLREEHDYIAKNIFK